MGESLGPVGPRLPGAFGGGSCPRSSLAGVSQGSSPSSAPPAYRDRRVGLALASRPADPTRGGGRGHLPGMSSFLPRGYLGPSARLLANGARLASSPSCLLSFPPPRAPSRTPYRLLPSSVKGPSRAPLPICLEFPPDVPSAVRNGVGAQDRLSGLSFLVPGGTFRTSSEPLRKGREVFFRPRLGFPDRLLIDSRLSGCFCSLLNNFPLRFLQFALSF